MSGDNRVAIFLTYSLWSEPPRMRHYVVDSVRSIYDKVIFIEFFPWECGKNEIREIDEKISVLSCYGNGSKLKNLLRYNIPILFSHYYQHLYEIIKASLGRELGENNEVHLYNFCYDMYHVYDDLMYTWTSYFCFDEWPKMLRSTSFFGKLKVVLRWRMLQRRENIVFHRAKIIFTPHRSLLNKAKAINSSVQMFYHGVSKSEIQPLAKRRVNSRYVKVGFGGYLNYRLDKELLRRVVDCPQMELHLIGEIESSFKDFASELQNNGCKIISGLTRENFVEYLAKMDVLIMPYLVNLNEVLAITTSAKTFQYVATLLPIVMPKMPNYIELGPDVLYTFNDQNQFIDLILRAANEDNEHKRLMRHQIALENTWEKRAKDIIITMNGRG